MENKNLFSESGIIITIILISIPIIIASILLIIKAYALLNRFIKRKNLEKFNEYLKDLDPEEIQKLEQRKTELAFSLSNNELAGIAAPVDSKGLINNVSEIESLVFRSCYSWFFIFYEIKIINYTKHLLFYSIFITASSNYLGFTSIRQQSRIIHSTAARSNVLPSFLFCRNGTYQSSIFSPIRIYIT